MVFNFVAHSTERKHIPSKLYKEESPKGSRDRLGTVTQRARLKKLDLHSLERRRLRGNLTEVIKWTKGLTEEA